MKKFKFKRLVLLTALLTIFTISSVSANAWSDLRTYSLSSSDSWKTTTTEGDKMASYKTTNSSYFDVYTHSKTMWTSPSFRMVNSNNEVRSGTVTTPGTGRTAVGSNNTGSPGYFYYGSVKPAWNQSGTDSIRLQFKAR